MSVAYTLDEINKLDKIKVSFLIIIFSPMSLDSIIISQIYDTFMTNKGGQR